MSSYRTVVNPATGERIADVTDTPDHLYEVIVGNAVNAQKGWAAADARTRELYMHAIADELTKHTTDLAQMESMQVGKPLGEAMVDVNKAIDWLRYFAGWPTKIAGEQLVGMSLPGWWRAGTVPRPVGVVGAIVPWNYPLMLAMWKIAPALAAGCSVIVKPAETTPLTIGAVVDAASKMLPGLVSAVYGGPEQGSKLVLDPRISKVSFTGSEEAGRQVGQWAGFHLKRCTLELGGKSAAIATPGAELSDVADTFASAIVHNAGQACNAPARLLVPEDELEDTVDLLLERWRNLRIGDPLSPRTEMGPLHSAAQYERVARALRIAKDEGGRVERATPTPAPATDGGESAQAGPWVSPAVVVPRDYRDTIAQEEVFGPVICVIPYRRLASAVLMANGTRFGLAAGVFGPLEEALPIAEKLEAGHVYVNGWSAQDPGSPFGGLGASGVGREHGRVGLDSYLEPTTVWIAG